MGKLVFKTMVGMILIVFVWANIASGEQTLVFAVGEWPPFVSKSLDNYGPTAEIVTLACEKAGFKAKFQFIKWKDAYSLVKNGVVVGSFPWKKTTEREQDMLFPKTPIMVSKEYVYYLKAKFPQGIDAITMDDLKPYKMTGVLSYWYEQPAKKAGVDMQLVENAQMAWMMIMLGQKEAYIENELVAMHDLKTFYPDDYNKVEHSGRPITRSDMFLLFSRSHPAVKDAMPKIDAQLKQLKESGEIDLILKK